MNPLDDFLPRFNFSERHSIDISAPASRTMNAVTVWRNEDDPLVRAVIRLREMPARLLGHARQRHLDLTDFTLLKRRGDTALIFGLIGAFWQADYGLRDIPSTDAFLAPRHDDVCKLALGLTVQPGSRNTHRLLTDTRVLCLTDLARRRFTPYWYLIRPVSGLIRRRMLTAIREQSESPPSHHPAPSIAMKLYDYPTAPNPRRVHFFIAEKGLTIPTVTVDLAKREQFAPTFRILNPSCTVPVLELDDGTAISEVPVICRYLEDLHPEPSLMGDTAEPRAIIGMWDRRMEIDGYLAAMEAVRNSLPGLAGRALVGPHGYAQILELAARGRQRLADFMADLNARLHDAPYVAGDAFSIADITAFITLDFARSRLKLALPEEAIALRGWFATIAKRPGAQA